MNSAAVARHPRRNARWWVDDDRLLERVTVRLEAGEVVEASDLQGLPVSARSEGPDWVLFWGEEPGWRGTSTSIARLFVQATLY